MFTIITWTLLNFHGIQSFPIQGSYFHTYGKKSQDSPYQLLQIHYSDQSTILFYLEVGRGAPSYNSGALYGRLIFNRKTGNYEYIPKDISSNCKLIFIKRENKIIIKTVSGECLFGYGVYADGIYTLNDKNNPTYFTDRTGRKRYFNKTSPETYGE
ncbi:hypothetical protein [Mucilaginibacter sp.]|uniref:hypothetical protein n=1 Tax=Mucilaginibacter sp. TaxID=1882438 RepID=UPI0026333A6C|nr:hypothetical protein [Mucilaginibacter sp.]MDB5032610.1 hypothetical protein [Mucilaginibacter sp.]